jgi:MFS transporter, OFA family, oxalate/formate antiporter
MKRLNGPRKLLTIGSIVFGVGLSLVAVSLAAGQEWLMYIGWAITGVGVGLAYSPPVATLLKWFPDRVGLASGIAITGFGLGAVIGFVQNLLAKLVLVRSDLLSFLVGHLLLP